MMNKPIFEGSWKELKGRVKQRWGRFTDDDLATVEGNIDEIVGRLQKIYGYTKEQAWSEFEEFKRSLLDRGAA